MTSTSRVGLELFLVSGLLLFLELACIRWFPAHVLFLTFFTNTVLLASFLGMSVGCLAANSTRDYLSWTPSLLALALGSAHLIEFERRRSGALTDVGNQASPQLVFFGTEPQHHDPASFFIPIEVVAALFFLLIAATFIGPGQRLGRLLNQLPNRIHAYTLNILGSLAGIALFAVFSTWALSSFWWFLLIAIGLVYFLSRQGRIVRVAALAGGVAILLLVLPTSGIDRSPSQSAKQHFWSPYYRIDYERDSRLITVNLIGHQQMVSRQMSFPAYALPHLLNRDAGGKPFADVLIIGAGSGTDVSHALQWIPVRIDAVEIDPVIRRLGDNHPDQPYRNRHVFVHLDDGRNFLRSTERKYDLIIYALVDSLVLHSSYSNIRLESYLFTSRAFADVQRHLKPGGLFVMYNYFRQGWIVARLHQTLEQVFGRGNPLVINLPSRRTIEPNQALFLEFTVFFAGQTDHLRRAFQQHSEYWLDRTSPPGPGSPNGFETRDGQREKSGWFQFGLSRIIPPREPLSMATDDWPFLYLRRPMIPALSLRGMLVMGGIAVLMMLVTVPRRNASPNRDVTANRAPLYVQMFFLGAGFMLIETKAVVHMALLFGGTWIVNAVVFSAILTMILAANLFVSRMRPSRVDYYYLGLVGTLLVNVLVPLDLFLGLNRTLQIVSSCLVVFAPVFFAAVIFAVSFRQAPEADRAFGANIAGAMTGGLAEYSSMLLGFQYLMLVAIGFYALSILGVRQNAT